MRERFGELLDDGFGLGVVHQAAFCRKTLDSIDDLVGAFYIFEDGMQHFPASARLQLLNFPTRVGVFQKARVEKVSTVGLHHLHLARIERVVHGFGLGVEEQRIGSLLLFAAGFALEMRRLPPFEKQFAVSGKSRRRVCLSVVGLVAFRHLSSFGLQQIGTPLGFVNHGAQQCGGQHFAEGVPRLVRRDDHDVLAWTSEGNVADVETFDAPTDVLIDIVRGINTFGGLFAERDGEEGNFVVGRFVGFHPQNVAGPVLFDFPIAIGDENGVEIETFRLVNGENANALGRSRGNALFV